MEPRPGSAGEFFQSNQAELRLKFCLELEAPEPRESLFWGPWLACSFQRHFVIIISDFGGNCFSGCHVGGGTLIIYRERETERQRFGEGARPCCPGLPRPPLGEPWKLFRCEASEAFAAFGLSGGEGDRALMG